MESHGYSWDGLETVPSDMTASSDLKAICSFHCMNAEHTTEAAGIFQKFLG